MSLHSMKIMRLGVADTLSCCFRSMVGQPETRKSDLVCYLQFTCVEPLDTNATSQVRAFFSTEADEDLNNDEEYSNEETEVDDAERKRQIAESTPLPSKTQPSRLDLLLQRLNTEIEVRRSSLAAASRPSEFLLEPPRKKRCIVRSESPEIYTGANRHTARLLLRSRASSMDCNWVGNLTRSLPLLYLPRTRRKGMMTLGDLSGTGFVHGSISSPAR